MMQYPVADASERTNSICSFDGDGGEEVDEAYDDGEDEEDDDEEEDDDGDGERL